MQLQIIEQREVLGKDFKIYGNFENPLFLAKDVASWIEHSNARMMLQSVDEDEKQCVSNPYALQGQKKTMVFNRVRIIRSANAVKKTDSKRI